MINKDNISYSNVIPNAEQFIKFREDCGWGRIELAQAKQALNNSLFFISAFNDKQLIGFGRVIGDGALNYYIQDLIVDTAYRKQNIGSTIMTLLMSHIKKNKLPGKCTVGLMAALNKHDFYQTFGFIYRPNNKFGPGMTVEVD